MAQLLAIELDFTAESIGNPSAEILKNCTHGVPIGEARHQNTMIDQRTPYVPNVNPADIAGPSRDIYARMGRENLYRMFEAFYRELGASAIRAMFPEDLITSSRKSAAFFAQLVGGPQEYTEQFGPPRMRARHLPFRITPRARVEWLSCFERVLAHAVDDFNFPAEHLEGFRQFLQKFSEWMVNEADDATGLRDP
jgi:hemoglobin